ncbi:MAG: CCA tRNA nucleotidyltransferase [Pseudoflavonifractor sp.]
MQIGAIPPEVESLCAVLQGAGHGAYPVGGAVRDLLLGRCPEDWDLCTSARPEQVMAVLPRTKPTGFRHGTITVLWGSRRFEVTTFRRETGHADGRHPDMVSFDADLPQDLARRDFTINAMALSPGGVVIDPFGGQDDLHAGLIRCVGDPQRRFREDGLRMLRAVRFAAQLGFTLEASTRAALLEHAQETAGLSPERIRQEMDKILLSPHPEQIALPISAGMLDHLFSQWRSVAALADLGRVPQNQADRWRSFCRLSGFPITALPVTKVLRRAVLGDAPSGGLG